MTIDDATLAARCLSGDEGSMRALVERFQSMVFGLCFRMLGQREDAEDVSQDVFLRVFRSLHRWDSNRPLKPWVMTIAVNRCRTAMERRSRQPLAVEFTVQPVDERLRPRDDGLAEELQLALGELREDYRTCIVLFHHQELSCVEIGEMLNCPPSTVKVWLHRARKELATALTRRGVSPHDQSELHRV